MTTLALLALAAGAVWLYRHRRPRTGAGASAAARARQLRTPAVRLAELVGVRTRSGDLAARYEAGSQGERATAALLAPLRWQGWTVLHDRRLPRGNANVDHLVIAPGGVVVLPDSKRWSARYRVRVDEGRLLHGTRDVTTRLDGLQHEAETVAEVLGVPVVPLVVMHGAPVEAGEQHLEGIRIVPADRALPVIRALGRTSIPHPASADVAARARRLLPPYTRR